LTNKTHTSEATLQQSPPTQKLLTPKLSLFPTNRTQTSNIPFRQLFQVLEFYPLDLKHKHYQLRSQDVQICVSGVEMVGRQKREMSAIVLNYFYAVGEAALALVAWLSKSWVIIQLAVSAPPAVFILYYW
jgi:hypothetical protein